MSLPSLAIPGQLLGPASKYAPGAGTHIQSSQIHASISGLVVLTAAPKPSKGSANTASTISNLPTLSIPRAQSSGAFTSNGGISVLPEVNSVVLARVTRLTPRQATVAILVVGNTVLPQPFQGLIRVQDVRATEKDRVKIAESFRVGDIVRGVVISLGDQSSYYLSTASNELGVVMAESEQGNVMYPVSWKEFRDPISGLVETRKVAKPF
ncbi:exosome 3'-_5 exonuclease subunit ski4 (Csl4) [Coniosporium apollinis]|uniref:Exosome 3'->5 exonuclease subunit ski4 (Csl4) n=2 Tax=Coniosporium TaxID=2810619 RepID=A0ABQ9NKW8_9PEZI|nr:exosome 3'->5 exonuclease subunit ski4 (Csl4) [Cladosporium sp. JES 115]KAJ9660843.1 exosome 3'->5 exonuclease subunit ski4 (Csl4) [Coniosporium apollinis]